MADSGTSLVHLTNAAGCDSAATLLLSIVPVITTNVNVANSTCANFSGGALQITASGGISPYKYRMDTAANNRYQSSPIFKPLKAGTYKINVKDSADCIATTAAINIASPAPITATFSKTDATCIGKANGTITLNISGGNAPYGFKIGTGGMYNDANPITGLKAGTYSIYIKDANGCTGLVSPVTVGQANVTC